MSMDQLSKFVDVVRRLRDPERGCPWDCAQDLMSLRRFLVEESGEYMDAVERGDVDSMRDELGDLLLQVVLNAQVAEDEGKFTLEDVAESESAKMIRRHPHVFGDEKLETSEELLASWERVKRSEASSAERRSAMDGIPRSMPGLSRAQKMSHRAARAGFEWENSGEALGKIREECEEVMSAHASGDIVRIEEELGDLLFAVVTYCRLSGLQAEEVMQKAIGKFSSRFRYVESHVDLQKASRDDILRSWRDAKASTCSDAAACKCIEESK